MKAMVRLGIIVLGILAIIALLVPAVIQAAEPIKIGVIYPLTGGAAAEGRELRAGAELALEIANKAYPNISMTMARTQGSESGRAQIELIFKDHEGNPTVGADLAKKLILDDKVVGILGCYHSAVTKTVSACANNTACP